VVVGGIAVGEVSADRGLVADEGVGDHRRGVGEDRILRADEVRALEHAFARAPADLERPALLHHVLEPGDPPDVHEMGGLAQPELEEGQQALPTGQHLRVVAVLGEQGHGFGQRSGGVVVERRRDHGALLPLGSLNGTKAGTRRG
jgi:hypothetical protein